MRLTSDELLGREGSPGSGGASWPTPPASLGVLGQIYFLTDPATQPFMTTADLCARFGVGQSTASAKARVIGQALDTSRLNPEWSLPGLLDQNPLVWMAEVNGFLVDLRDMPREVQQIAFDKGMIPFIPADQEQGPG
jgi:Domain of unknown function (DUF6398)